MTEKIIDVKDLIKEYGDFTAVDSISFGVDKGEIFGLIGPNGAGKTTTLRVLATLLKITSGDVKIAGYDVKKEGDEVRKMISYLPEDAGAYKNLTGKEYLRFIAKFFDGNSSVDEMVDRGVKIASLEGKINDKIDTYSKGMKRRLLIGRTFMIDPKLAILDEPTSGLDVINAREIRELIKNYASEGTTILLSSHNMLEVDFLCERISLINRGKIVESGRPKSLKNKYEAENIEEVFTKVVR